MDKTQVLVTGGSGFIGSGLVARLAAEAQWQVKASVRAGKSIAVAGVEAVEVCDITASTDWQHALHGIDVVVHTAAVAHVRSFNSAEQLARLHATNVDGAVNLARQALAAGVRRFVFISSIGVNGTAATHQPFNESSPADPHAAYAQSKRDAETALQALFSDSAAELVTIRPPLIYAAHAIGNFQRLLWLVEQGLPLPFAGVDNQRSLVGLDNLLDFIRCCLTHPAAANELFLLAEGPGISTAQIITYLARGMDKRTRLFAFPRALIALACRVAGMGGIYTQLFESLVIDSSKAQRLLGWQPVITTEAGLLAAGKAYRQQRSREHV